MEDDFKGQAIKVLAELLGDGKLTLPPDTFLKIVMGDPTPKSQVPSSPFRAIFVAPSLRWASARAHEFHYGEGEWYYVPYGRVWERGKLHAFMPDDEGDPVIYIARPDNPSFSEEEDEKNMLAWLYSKNFEIVDLDAIGQNG